MNTEAVFCSFWFWLNRTVGLPLKKKNSRKSVQIKFQMKVPGGTLLGFTVDRGGTVEPSVDRASFSIVRISVVRIVVKSVEWSEIVKYEE